MRRLLTALILLLAVFLLLSRLAEVEQVLETLQRGNVLWLGLAGVLQLAWLANATFTYQRLYRLLGMSSPFRHLLPLATTSNFVNTVAPSGGVGGMAVFISHGRRHGLPAARVTIVGVLFVLFDYFAFLCILALGLVVLVRRQNLDFVEVGASAILLVTTLTMAGLLALGAAAPPAFERVLLWGARTYNRLIYPIVRRPYLSEARAHSFAAETAEALQALRIHPQHYLLPAALALLGKTILMLVLVLTFLAFGVPFTSGTIIGGFSIGYLFMIVSPTPGGIGVVEGAMTLALTSLRVPLAAATVITLAYRGITFWLPFAYGFIALRVLQKQWNNSEPEQVTV
jgi:glycosyltransferase 2 family protein